MSVLIRQCLLALVMLLSAASLIAQEQPARSSAQGWGVPGTPLNCEMNFQNLEYVSSLMRSQKSQNGTLILIARLGTGEKQREMNRRRLYNVRLKLSSQLNVPTEKIIIAEGERVKGFGRIEFYVVGELIGALLIPKHSDICIGCCGPDERFYPYKKSFESKTTQRKRYSSPAEYSRAEIVMRGRGNIWRIFCR